MLGWGLTKTPAGLGGRGKCGESTWTDKTLRIFGFRRALHPLFEGPVSLFPNILSNGLSETVIFITSRYILYNVVESVVRLVGVPQALVVRPGSHPS